MYNYFFADFIILLPNQNAITALNIACVSKSHAATIPSSTSPPPFTAIITCVTFTKAKTENNKTSLKISLKYYEGDPVIKEIKRISKPGRRVYSRATSIPKVMNGLGLAILSTPKGVMSDTEARKNNVGGEIICRVF